MKRLQTALAASLFLTILGTAAAQETADRYIVQFKNANSAKAALHSAGASILLNLEEQNAAAVRIPARALEALRQNPNIELIEVDQRRYPMAQTTPYGIPMVQADQLSDAGAAGRKVCIIDSGYSLAHEDLDDDSSITGQNDPTGSGPWSTDLCGHGTHVAGTISATNNSVGVLGVLPGGN